MAIPDHIRRNFETMVAAAKAGDLALVECRDAKNGEIRHVMCAVGNQDDEYVLTPFGHLAPDNPFEAYIPPA